MKKYLFFILCAAVTSCLCVCMSGCNKPSKVEQFRAEKHVRDSVALAEQQRSMEFYQNQLEALLPQADSLIALFKYEKNDKYQDHGCYVAIGKNGLRVLLRDDAEQLLLYRNGKRIETADDAAVQRAQHLQIVMHDIRELEQRIARTSLEIQKYEKRLTNEQTTP